MTTQHTPHDRGPLPWIFLAAVLLNGCAVARQYSAPPVMSATRLVEADRPALATAGDSSRLADRTGPRNVLVLSGGGMNGAYSAGVLKGWTASDARPQFDVVTGISTGSLIAPFAFLGPEYDAELERLYTSLRQENIFRPRLLWLDSLGSSAPLEQQIAAGATPEVLQRIADAHHQGRRLYVGTTNLDTKSLVVWDLGAIAARNTAESKVLFQKVLLASCSIPGLFPPVAVDIEVDGQRFTELHVDGSVTACAFLLPSMVGIGPNGEQPPEDNRASVHVIVAGKLQPTIAPARRELFAIAGESMNTVLQAKTDGELARLFLLSRYANADFRLTGIPQDCQMSDNSMSFDPQVMRQLFELGCRNGRDGEAWQPFPPGLAPDRIATPRTDTRFVAVHETSPATSWTPDKIRITLDDNNPTVGRKDSTAPRGLSESWKQ